MCEYEGVYCVKSIELNKFVYACGGGGTNKNSKEDQWNFHSREKRWQIHGGRDTDQKSLEEKVGRG